MRVEHELLGWIPINSRLYAVRLDSSVRVNNSRPMRIYIRSLIMAFLKRKMNSTRSYLEYSKLSVLRTLWPLLVILAPN